MDLKLQEIFQEKEKRIRKYGYIINISVKEQILFQWLKKIKLEPQFMFLVPLEL